MNKSKFNNHQAKKDRRKEKKKNLNQLVINKDGSKKHIIHERNSKVSEKGFEKIERLNDILGSTVKRRFVMNGPKKKEKLAKEFMNELKKERLKKEKKKAEKQILKYQNKRQNYLKKQVI